MEIIKEGKIDTKIFTCSDCGCVFSANKREYYESASFFGCYCPQCNTCCTIWKEDIENGQKQSE